MDLSFHPQSLISTQTKFSRLRDEILSRHFVIIHGLLINTLHRQYCRFLLGRKSGDTIEGGYNIDGGGATIYGSLNLPFGHTFLAKKCQNTEIS